MNSIQWPSRPNFSIQCSRAINETFTVETAKHSMQYASILHLGPLAPTLLHCTITCRSRLRTGPGVYHGLRFIRPCISSFIWLAKLITYLQHSHSLILPRIFCIRKQNNICKWFARAGPVKTFWNHGPKPDTACDFSIFHSFGPARSVVFLVSLIVCSASPRDSQDVFCFARCLRCVASFSSFWGRNVLVCQRPAVALGSRLLPTIGVRSRVNYTRSHRYFDKCLWVAWAVHRSAFIRHYIYKTVRLKQRQIAK